MAASGTRVRPGRSASGRGVVAVTGAASDLGRLATQRLVQDAAYDRVLTLDVERPDVAGTTFRRADVRDPALATRLAGVDTVVHLATTREPGEDAAGRRALNVRGTETLLRSAAAAGVRRVVLVTSAMVYGAEPANEVPLPEDAPLRAAPSLGLVGDWLEMERLAGRAARGNRALRLVRLRPASLVGAVVDPVLPRLFDAPRLLVIRGSQPRWQFCHSDDLVSAIAHAAAGEIDGVLTVGCEGWLEHAEVEQISGMRSVVVPAVVATATAERLQRVGVISAPADELRYLTAPWIVGSQRLRATGWTPAWSNAAALAEHVEGRRRSSATLRRDATRAAAGAAVAVAGAVAVARARAARRRRLG